MRNRIRCLKCNTVIESKYRRDFVWCPCHTVFIDGGNAYKRMGGDLAQIRIVQDDGTELPLQEVERGSAPERSAEHSK